MSNDPIEVGFGRDGDAQCRHDRWRRSDAGRPAWQHDTAERGGSAGPLGLRTVPVLVAAELLWLLRAALGVGLAPLAPVVTPIPVPRINPE